MKKFNVKTENKGKNLSIQLDILAGFPPVVCILKYKIVKKMASVSEEMVCGVFQCLFLLLWREDGWVGWRDDTEEILGIRTTHGQLPLLIHLPYRHFLSLSTLTKLLVRGGG